MRNVAFVAGVLGAAVLLGGALSLAQSAGKKKTVRRSRPPKFDQGVLDLFAPDPKSLLKGERPARTGTARPVVPVPTPGGKTPTPPPAAGGFAWSKIISRDTLESEVKRMNDVVQTTVTTPGRYNSGDHRQGQICFSTLAVVFAVINEYDGDVRWKDLAAGTRNLFARAGKNSKVGSDAAYQEAKLRRDDLQQLVRSILIDVPKTDAKTVWPDVTERSPLMKRLELAYDKRIKGWVSSGGEFSNRGAEIAHEAEIVAMLAEVLTRQGMKDGDEQEYTGLAVQMKTAARSLVEAVKTKDYAGASQAAAGITKSCSACHETWR